MEAWEVGITFLGTQHSHVEAPGVMAHDSRSQECVSPPPATAQLACLLACLPCPRLSRALGKPVRGLRRGKRA